MKTIPANLRTHINQEVTALCTCWRIRRVDGAELYFTDSDEDVVEDGKTYTSIGAYKRTAIESTASLAVDNLEVVGIANQLVLPEHELQAGLFDNAEVFIFVTSWQGGVSGAVKMRRGFFGEVQVMPNGTYQVELRGIMQRLAHTYTNVFTPSCRLDLGEKSCGIPIPGGQVYRSTAYAVGDTVIAPTTANMGRVGTYNKLPIGDNSFELAGAAGNLTNSVFWRQTGSNPVVFDNTTPETGLYVARGASAGPSEITQDIDLIDTVQLSSTAIDTNQSALTLYAWRRDTGGTGRVRMDYLDASMNTLGFGRSVRADATKMTTSSNIALAGDFTIEAWVYLNPGATLYKAGLGGFGTSTSAGDANEAADIRFDPPRLFHNPPPPADTSGTNAEYGTSTQSLTTGRWYHVAVTRRVSDGRVTTYIDGVQRGQSTGYTATFNLAFVMSTIDGTTDAYYDEYRVWNIERTSYEIYGDMNQTLVGTETGLIHYWRFNGEDGSASTGLITVITGANTFESGRVAPVAVQASHTTFNTASSSTGLENAGPAWVLRSFQNRDIPVGSRYVRIRFDATTDGNFIDGLFGWSVDATGTQIPSNLGENTHYRCTTAGTTSDTIPTYGGATVSDGTAVFTLDTDPWARTGLVTASDGPRVFRALVTEPRAVDAWFNGGVVTFETGPNKGVSMEVKDWTQASGQIELFLSLPFNIEPGDIFRVYPGCDKSRVSCAAIFINSLNFRGFPDVPGQDDLYRYPDARQ